MRHNQGAIIVLSAPSGCGKGTVLKELLEKNKNVFLSVSATTRSPREGEVDGKQYYFLTKEDFKRRIEQNGMLEYAEYLGNYYGTPLEPVRRQCAEGNHVILEIEVQGALQIKQKHPEAVLIFILPPSFAELRRRLTDRGTETKEVIDSRLEKAKQEIDYADRYDFCVVNDTVEQTVAEIETIMAAASYQTVYQQDKIAQLRLEMNQE